ncbi:hypothetical protein RB25_03320 [Herbaspirillum rubrisubalbicans]|jgi:hypothetical protein|uniref:Transmembrane protein n=1 Tax=Herbaspirillum rubrisubalbicans TaxID=80842 RepID=A0ABX9C3A1_9BURK|nr:hypothetical protein [Herbaspirillum rubrisubalbicans]RAM64658.1 hypothetical protein RB24_10700 [Herbaspirillum rubrisubalbicans]RAN49894.1 hypothetical protein RB25_03320 [Herbaspirillum rubrisubalbicans]
MNPPTPRLRFLLFLYGSPNLLGCVFALPIPLLYLVGYFGADALVLTPFAYLIGWLLSIDDKKTGNKILKEAQEHPLSQTIDKLLEQSGSRLPTEVVEKLQAMDRIVDDLALRAQSGSISMEHSIELINTVTRNLPQTLGNYLKLPPLFAEIHRMEDGKTCKQLLMEQLDLLTAELEQLSASINAGDAQSLIANGKFLREKSKPISFV